MKTIVCVIGTLRGGEVAWKSLINHVLNPLTADLALLVTKCDSTTILHEVSKYDWSFEEPEDWGCELNRVCNECGITENRWIDVARRTSYEGFWGGVVIDGTVMKGSGALIMILRDKLLEYLDILKRYDKIIITRSDHFYLFDHPQPSTQPIIEVPTGEDWWGITDRHHVVDKTLVETYLCIARWWMQNVNVVDKQITKHHNSEQLIAVYFKELGLTYCRIKRCMVTIALKSDATRWKQASVEFPGYPGTLLKYPHEYFSHYLNSKRMRRKPLGSRIKYVNNFENIH